MPFVVFNVPKSCHL